MKFGATLRAAAESARLHAHADHLVPYERLKAALRQPALPGPAEFLGELKSIFGRFATSPRPAKMRQNTYHRCITPPSQYLLLDAFTGDMCRHEFLPTLAAFVGRAVPAGAYAVRGCSQDS